MKKILLFFVLGYAVVYIGMEFFKNNHQDLPDDEYTQFPTETKLRLRKSALSCELEKILVQTVSSESRSLLGSNYLQTWEVVVLNHKKQPRSIYLITGEEDPFRQNQEVFVATNCKAMDEKAEKDLLAHTEDGCTGLYLWDKKNYQIRRQCGYIVYDKPYFLREN